MTFARRRIDLVFQLGKGEFGLDGADTVEMSGLRCAAEITTAGGASMAECHLRVFGMRLDVMNKLTTLQSTRGAIRRNVLVVRAGDDDSGLATIFAGNIVEAWVDASNAPDVVFVVSAYAGMIDAIKPAPPTSYRGTVDAALVVRGIASQMTPDGGDPVPGTEETAVGLQFVNYGVNVQISNPYLHGSLRNQLLQIAKAGNFNAVIENNAVVIWPAGTSRGELVPRIAADTGMVGYPAYTQEGISVTTLFNPSQRVTDVVYGSQIELDTILTPAKGKWVVSKVVHELQSEIYGGAWFTHIDAGLFDSTAPVASV